MSRNDVVIVDAVRTPVGRVKGLTAGVRADHLGACAIEALRARSGLDAARIDDVIFGCVTQIGEQSANIARTAVLSAGWPESVPGLTIDRKCGSSEAAVHIASGMIAAGVAEIAVAGGAENMSRVPMGSNRALHGEAFGHVLQDRFEMVSQGEAAERIAKQWGITRTDLDTFALTSHARASAAADAGRFKAEIVPVDLDRWQDPELPATGQVIDQDETIRPDSTLDRLATLKPSFRENGQITAGNASQMSNGAAALLLTSAKTAGSLGLRARARVVAACSVGSDPTLMLTGPVAATRRVLEQAGLTLGDIDLFEVNEAFASIPLMWLRETGVDPQIVNVNGGAIALGHPLGGSGARIMTTLLNELERRGARYGLQTMCCAGGLATATILERLD